MRILIASSIDKSAVIQLQELHDVICAFNEPADRLASLMADREVIIFRSGVNFTNAMLAGAPEMKLLIRAGCGLDNLDVEYVAGRGIELRRIPEPAAQAVSEMAVALMLALARNLREADRLLRQGYWAKGELQCYLLAGKTLGIVGAGNIGSRVGELAAALGMRPIGCVKVPTAEAKARLASRGIRLASFDEVMSSGDFVSLHVPLDSSTRGLINARALARMKPGSYLINLARGGVVDEAALLAELTGGERLRGAALDVHQHEGHGKISPLAALPNVVLTPHLGANTVDTQREIGRRIVDIIAQFGSAMTAQSAAPTRAAAGAD